ncbi:MAG: tail protein X [Synergistaceae bacterium]|nr:tail protein X [Synergistaceae bacterium]
MRTYRTEQGDTWDMIALRMYPKIGAEKLMDILLDYNPDHIHTVIFPANVILNVPDVDVPVISTLPAWKR